MALQVYQRCEIASLSQRLLEPKLNHAAVARAVHCDVGTVKRWLKQLKQSKDLTDAPLSGWPRARSLARLLFSCSFERRALKNTCTLSLRLSRTRFGNLNVFRDESPILFRWLKKCFCCLYVFLATCFHGSWCMKKLSWLRLWQKVENSVLKSLIDPENTDEHSEKSSCFFGLIDITVLRRTLSFPRVRAIVCENVNELDKHTLSIVRKVRNGDWCPNSVCGRMSRKPMNFSCLFDS